ncbi:protein phosphatase 3 regulatory subunit b alpha isoform type 1 [Anaeramoeba flamelloides]|uniref:Protein phosphatase 3 regulatory subunit b alpha isoform type 1 n=1 Tax=Anaeramoeba flamelloides TaxID=1746091 RepID=A0ABQ8XX77_9EUKA|nr:protein phosphatase 3 regulatory subunit b alpha isoform type 1 [Anaeramoeba flamelloides]
MGGLFSKDDELTQEDLEELQEMSNFNQKQIRRLYKRFKRLDKDGSGSITLDEFYSIPELVMNPLNIRVIGLFDPECEDVEKVSVNFKQFLKTLSVFSPNGSKEDKLKYAFKVYDIAGDDLIDEHELFSLLKLMVGESIKTHEILYIVEKVIEEVDTTMDGCISFKEFCNYEIFYVIQKKEKKGRDTNSSNDSGCSSDNEKDEKESETLVIKTNEPNYLLDNLEPGKEYQVKVKAHNNIGLSKEPTKKTFKTSSGEPNKIKKIDCADVYQDKNVEPIEVKLSSEENKFTFENLNANTDYKLDIQSKNENGYSPNSDSLVFKTGSTHLVGIEKAKRVKIGTKFCKLKWKEPDDGGSPIDYYDVHIYDQNEIYQKKKKKNNKNRKEKKKKKKRGKRRRGKAKNEHLKYR